MKKVFICYDHSEDMRYKDLLRAWNANVDFDFEFDERSPDNLIDSEEAKKMQAILIDKIKASECILVIIGRQSHTSKWMAWEIQTAKRADIQLKFAAVKLDRSFTEPEGLPVPATSFAYSFTMESVLNALQQARNRY